MRAAVAASMAPLSDCRQRLPSPRSRVAAAGPPSSPRPTLAGLSLGLDIAGGADHLVEWVDDVDDGLNALESMSSARQRAFGCENLTLLEIAPQAMARR